MVIPVIIAIGMSLTSYDMVNPPTFVGLNNFKRLLIKDDVFMLSVKKYVYLCVVYRPDWIYCQLFDGMGIGKSKSQISFFDVFLYPIYC